MALKYKVVRSAIRPQLYVSGTSKPLCLVETEDVAIPQKKQVWGNYQSKKYVSY